MQITRLLTVIEEETEFDIFMEKVKNFFFTSDTGSRMTSLRIFITALLVGVFAFTVVFAVKKKAAKRFVEAVIRLGAHTPETAKTLAELGLSGDKGVLRALKSGALSRMTSTVEGDEYNARIFGKIDGANGKTDGTDKADGKSGSKKTKTKKISAPIYKANPEKDRFYLTEKKSLSLQSIYGGRLGTLGTIVLSAVVCVGLWFALDAAVPFFLSLLDLGL